MKAASLFAGMGGHHSARSETEEWLTPPSVIDALGGWQSFDLDPCTPIAQPYPTAKTRFTALENGLTKEWFGRVWLNPPYSTRKIPKWLARLTVHNCGIALIFARTETDTFFRYVWKRASALLFLRGRLHFHFPDGRQSPHDSGAPSVLCAYGFRDGDLLADCGIDGQFVPLMLPRGIAIVALEESWRDVVAGALRNRGPVRLDDLYRCVSRHPRVQKNPHWQAKVRQVLQRGPFRNVDRGVWESEAA